jgi:hypothetical protein
MNLLSLVFVNLGRNKIRTVLTLMSVMVALFLFCALRGVLDTLQESIKAGAETRLVVRNAVSLVQPLPQSYKQRLQAVPGVERVAISNWFGGQDPADTKGFFATAGRRLSADLQRRFRDREKPRRRPVALPAAVETRRLLRRAGRVHRRHELKSRRAGSSGRR